MNLLKNRVSELSILSFVNRTRKITEKQKKILERLWPLFGINYKNKKINIENIFRNKKSLNIEIGFGQGNCLIQNAKKFPKENFLGIEIYLPGIIYCLKQANNSKIKNLKIIRYNAYEVLKNMIPDYSVKLIQIFFPDPWEKKKHNKRRIINNDFLNLIKNKIKINGYIHIITDSQQYSLYILKIINKEYFIRSEIKNSNINFLHRSLTKFELNSKKLNRKIIELIFKRI